MTLTTLQTPHFCLLSSHSALHTMTAHIAPLPRHAPGHHTHCSAIPDHSALTLQVTLRARLCSPICHRTRSRHSHQQHSSSLIQGLISTRTLAIPCTQARLHKRSQAIPALGLSTQNTIRTGGGHQAVRGSSPDSSLGSSMY